MSRKTLSRKMTKIGQGLDRSLAAYATAAGAAGVGLVTLAQPVEAKIVFTPTHKTIFPNTTLKIDVNNDGAADFSITNFSDHTSNSRTRFANGYIMAAGLQASNAFAHYSRFVANLKAGVRVTSTIFSGSPSFMFACHTSKSFASQTGPWNRGTNRFVGLRLSINGQIHYGWARLSAKEGPAPCEVKLVLTGYAYETVANQPITTGQTKGLAEVAAFDHLLATPAGVASLGAMALGERGLAIWRRDDEKGFCLRSL